MKILRQSILNNFETCPRLCWEKWGSFGEEESTTQHGEDDEGLGNKYSGTGIKFHEVMEIWGNKQIEGGEMTLVELHDLMSEKFNDLEPNLFKDEIERDKFYNSLHEQIEWIYGKFINIPPTLVEWSFEFDNLIEGLPPFSGTMDRIQGSMITQDIDIIDYKTGAVYTKKEMLSNMQATIYSLAFYKEFGFFPKRFVFYFSKSKKIREIMITPMFIEAGIARIKGVWLSILNGNFKPPGKSRVKYFCEHFCDSTTCPKKPKKRPKGWEGVGFEIFRPEIDYEFRSNNNEEENEND